MFQNNDKVITVVMATASSPRAPGEFSTPRNGSCPAPTCRDGAHQAYAGFTRPAAVVGVLRKQTLTEVKVVNPAQTPEAISLKLQAVMKEVAVRK